MDADAGAVAHTTGAHGPVGTVAVRLFAGLETQTRGGRSEQSVPLSAAPTVAALCEALGLAPGAAGLILVNGVHAHGDVVLRDGDKVSLFAPVGGG